MSDDPQTAPPRVARPAPHAPKVREPGRCQLCHGFGDVQQHWPSTVPGRFVEICPSCKALGDLEIARRLPPWRRDGASV